MGHGFVYDDLHVIVNNPLIHTLANWSSILASPWSGPELYRPLTLLTLALDWSISGGNPHVFHAANVLFHCVATGLVFLLVRAYLPPLGATAAALCFAVHPVHVEAVANVVGRAEVLAALFVVAAALVYRADGALARTRDRTWRRWLTSFGTLGLLALALGSKEIAFATPGIFLIVDWLDAKQVGTRPSGRLANHWVLWLASVALAVEFLWVRHLVVGDLAGVHPAPGIEGEGLGGRALVMAPVVLEYVRLLFFPLDLSADYSPDFLRPVAALKPGAVVGFAMVVAAVALAVAVRDRAPAVSFGLAWIGGTLLVVSNVLVPTGVILAERSMYLPSVGAVLLFGWVVTWGVTRWRVATITAVTLALALGMVRTLTRVPVWRTLDGFFTQLVKDAPGSYRGYWVASALAYQAADRERGEALAIRALQIQPVFANLWEYVARRYEEDQRWLDAGNALNAGFRLDSSRLVTAAEAMVDYVRAGALDSAAAVGRRARRLDPHDFRVKIAMSDLALARGRPLEAMTLRRQVAWRFPGAWQYWLLTARAAVQASFCPEVGRSLARLRALKPDLPELAALDGEAREAGCLPAK